jgi:diaminopropionate ammonia-lyase
VRPSSGHLGTPDPSFRFFSPDELETQRTYFAAHPELTPTPLRTLPALATSLGLGALWVKDETARFGLPAFKSLGARFAVDQLATAGRLDNTTLVCASEGNHGRAVAAAARAAGLQARVYVGARVAEARAEAIRGEGATVVRVDGTYDEAVRRAAEDAATHRWTVVSDTGWAGYDEIPRLIMLGYTRMLDECADTWEEPPDLVVVQGGVGGMAGAVAGWWALQTCVPRPSLICVEALEAACLQASARRGAPTRVEGPLDTVMGGLRCGEVSTTAFPAVAAGCDAYVAIDDGWAFEAMKRLARPSAGDPRVHAGPSGAAGLGALLALASDPALAALREVLRPGPAMKALVIATEGVTEPELFRQVITE